MPSKKKKPAAADAAAPDAPAPPPAPAAKAEPKAAAAPPPSKASAKAKPQAAPKVEAAPKAAAPKAEAAKAEAKAKPKAKEQASGGGLLGGLMNALTGSDKAEAKPKSDAKPKPEGQPKKKQPEQPKKKAAPAKKEEEDTRPARVEIVQPFEMLASEDAMGDDWECAASSSKKNQRRKERQVEQKELEKTATGAHKAGQQHVVGANFVEAPKDPKQQPAKKAKEVSAAELAAPIIEATTEKKKEEAKPEVFTETIIVPEEKVGVVIGPKGKNLRLIQEKTACSRIDTAGSSFTVVGSANSVKAACCAIQELMDNGYTSLAYDKFTESFVQVLPIRYPDLIGKQGATVIKIKEELGVDIKFPEVQKGNNRKQKVKVAGNPDAVEKAIAILTEISVYHHNELTHPGMIHEEVDVPDWAFRFLIGKAGSEMRHIQNNYRCKVVLPNENSDCEKTLIVGMPDDVARCKTYVEKKVYNEEHKTNEREGRAGGDDHWGEDEEHESWMDAYMYKRR